MTSISLQGADKAIALLLKGPQMAKNAASRAINNDLREVQTETGKTILPDAFTVRTKWWKPGMRTGFNIQFSKPETLSGVLGSSADWLKLQEFGGAKKPTTSQHVAIPAPDYKPRMAIMARRIKPRAILNRKSAKAFKLPSGIFARDEVTKQLKTLFVFEQSVGLKPILHFEQRASQMAEKRFNFHFAVAFAGLLEREIKR